MAPAGTASQFDRVALERRQALTGSTGPAALVRNGKVFGIACFACLGGLLYGYNQGVFSGVLTMISFQNHMGTYTSNQTKKGWLISILELGAWVGTLYSGFLAEIFSRKYAILINTAIFIVGVVIQATAITSAGATSILAGQFVTGMGVGALSMIVPMYNAECAPLEVRDALVGLQQLAITTGIMISFWVDCGTNYIGGTGPGEMDIIFGSAGLAAADAERMHEINREIGLDHVVREGGIAGRHHYHHEKSAYMAEKSGVQHKDSASL